MRPRTWQRQLIQLFRRRLTLSTDQGRDLLVHAGPGAGKTIAALLSFKAMRKEGLLSSILVFCHRNSILNQWQKSSNLLGLTLADIDSYQCQRVIPSQVDGWILTYQGASKKLEELREGLGTLAFKNLLAVADEVHHLGLDPLEIEGAAWGRAFLQLTENSRIRLGLTGTPFRADNLAFCSARKIRLQLKGEVIEQISPDLCVEPIELISAGDVRPLEFHFQDGWVEHLREGCPDRDVSPLSKECRESWRARNLRRAVCLSDCSSIAQQLLIRARKRLEMVRNEHANAAGLVIARDIEHATGIAQLLRENGDIVELVHSQERDASFRLKEFQLGKAKWLVSVDMCSEGFDAPRLRVVAYLTTVVTKSRFIQGITRAVRMCSSRAGIEPVPRNPSYVFAPADPLLMEYARNWSRTKPYLLRVSEADHSQESNFGEFKGPTLPLEAVRDGAGELIRMRTAELPHFL